MDSKRKGTPIPVPKESSYFASKPSTANPLTKGQKKPGPSSVSKTKKEKGRQAVDRLLDDGIGTFNKRSSLETTAPTRPAFQAHRRSPSGIMMNSNTIHSDHHRNTTLSVLEKMNSSWPSIHPQEQIVRPWKTLDVGKAAQLPHEKKETLIISDDDADGPFTPVVKQTALLSSSTKQLKPLMREESTNRVRKMATKTPATQDQRKLDFQSSVKSNPQTSSVKSNSQTSSVKELILSVFDIWFVPHYGRSTLEQIAEEPVAPSFFVAVRERGIYVISGKNTTLIDNDVKKVSYHLQSNVGAMFFFYRDGSTRIYHGTPTGELPAQKNFEVDLKPAR
jgi:hypothetical protein